MQIVIDIPEEEYQTYINHTEAILDKSIPLVHQDLLKAVINGTPLPEHHGRIIDESQIKHIDCHTEQELYGTKIRYVKTTDAPTIIEADTEGRDKK